MGHTEAQVVDPEPGGVPVTVPRPAVPGEVGPICDAATLTFIQDYPLLMAVDGIGPLPSYLEPYSFRAWLSVILKYLRWSLDRLAPALPSHQFLAEPVH